MALGKHGIEYEVLEGRDRPPGGWSDVEVAGVACDSEDRVYVFNRGKYPVVVFDKEGEFPDARGGGMSAAPDGKWADTKGDLYVGEVSVSAGAVKRMAPLKVHCFQKFRRRAG